MRSALQFIFFIFGLAIMQDVDEVVYIGEKARQHIAIQHGRRGDEE